MSLAKYYEVGKINLLNNLAYKAEFIIHGLFIGLIIFIFVNLWKAVYSSKSTIEGFTIAMMIWYLVMTESIVTAQGHIIKELNAEIKNGEIANSLNKPYHFLGYHFAKCMAGIGLSFAMTLVIGGIIAYLLVGPFTLAWYTLPFIAIAVVFALIIDYCINTLIGLFAFWMEDTSAFEFLYAKIVFVAGGMLVPLEIFPEMISKVLSKLPFSYIAYHPGKLFVSFSFADFQQVIMGQGVYLIILIPLLFLIFYRAMKKVQINGG